MATRMVTLELKPANATLEHVRKKLKLRKSEVDEEFGLISVSPEKNLYAILVDEKVAARIEGSAGVVGSYSNPRIEPFGPPKSSGEREPRG